MSVWWIILLGLLVLGLMLIVAGSLLHKSSPGLSSTKESSSSRSSKASSTKESSTSKVCVFDLDGTLTTCPNCPALKACQDAGWKIAVATASPRDPSLCCTGEAWMTSNLCPNGTCIIPEEDWYYAGTGGLVHGKDIPVYDNAGKQPDSADKQWALAQLADRYNSSKACTVLFDDMETYREPVEAAGYSTLCAWDPSVEAVAQDFKDGAKSCEFISC